MVNRNGPNSQRPKDIPSILNHKAKILTEMRPMLPWFTLVEDIKHAILNSYYHARDSHGQVRSGLNIR